MRSNTLLFLFAAALLVVAGCGGGGGGLVPTPPPVPTTKTATVAVAPNQSAELVLGDVKLAIPKDAYPQGASVTMTISKSSVFPAGSEVQQIVPGSQIEICQSTPSKLSLKLLDQRKGIYRDTGKILYLFLKHLSDGWDYLNQITPDSLVIPGVYIPPETFDKVTGKVTGIFSAVPVKPVGPSGLFRKQGKAISAGGHYAVVVHGFNDGTYSFDAFAQFLFSSGGYDGVYLFGYDWRDRITNSAKSLASELGKTADSNATMDVYAHSMGVAVSRYAIEKLHQTKGIKRFISICGANKGSAFADISAAIHFFRRDFLNRTDTDRMPGGFLAFDTASVEDLIPNGSFITVLNTNQTEQKPTIEYDIVYTLNDEVVGASSGKGQDIPFYLFTSGGVNYLSSFGNHSFLVKNATGISKFGTMLKSLDNSIALTVTPDKNPCEIESSRNIWIDYLSIKGSGAAQTKIIDMSVDMFGASGGWMNRFWYDPTAPSNTPYAKDYRVWGLQIQDSQAKRFKFMVAPGSNGATIDQVGPNCRQVSAFVVVRYQDGDGAGREKAVSVLITLTSDNIKPVTPPLRSLQRCFDR